MNRRDELAAGLEAIKGSIARACQRNGRSSHEVTLLVVTKFFPSRDVALLYELGCRDFGESRDQEAKAKIAELSDTVPGARWHMVGNIQHNKAKSLATWAHMIHSLDNERLVHQLNKAVSAQGRAPLDVLMQVSLDGDERRGGVHPDHAEALAHTVSSSPGLRLRGIMAVPPLHADPRISYETLATIHCSLHKLYPTADILSAGMSGDFETAIATGSTCVRVGTAILGQRPILSP